jgi:hypothetical protein
MAKGLRGRATFDARFAIIAIKFAPKAVDPAQKTCIAARLLRIQ